MKKNLLLYFLLMFNFIFSQKIESENFIIKDSIQIQTKDHATLSLIIVLNKNKEPQNTILVNTIYPDPKNINLVKNFVENNYAGVILYPRGKYLSENNIEPFEHEAEDINEVIDWIIQQPWSNGKVGMIGGSYLGFSQWAATKNLHPALKTIVPQAATGVGIAGLPFNNGVFMNYSLQWLEYVTGNKTTDSKSFNDQKKWNSIFKRWYESGKSYRKLDSISGKPNTIFQRWLNHPSYDDYWKKMIPYKEEFSKINIPILSTTGYYDVDRYGALYYFNEHHKYYKKTEHYLIIGPYDHWGSQGFIKNELRGYKIDPVASIDFNKIWLEWFDYIFKNKPKPAFLRNKINYQIMGMNQWESAESMDVFNEAKTKFYFENNDGKLSLSSVKNRKENFSTLYIDYKERNDAEEVFNLKYNILDQFIYTKNNLLFETKTFDKPFELSGNISGNLNISINKKDLDLYFNLYEKMQDDQYFLLYSYVSRASFAKNKEKRNLLMPEKIETIPIIANDFTSKKIDKGNKLVLMIGVVKNPYWQINYGSGKEVSEETISDAKDPLKIKLYNSSYVEIPILQKE